MGALGLDKNSFVGDDKGTMANTLSKMRFRSVNKGGRRVVSQMAFVSLSMREPADSFQIGPDFVGFRAF